MEQTILKSLLDKALLKKVTVGNLTLTMSSAEKNGRTIAIVHFSYYDVSILDKVLFDADAVPFLRLLIADKISFELVNITNSKVSLRVGGVD